MRTDDGFLKNCTDINILQHIAEHLDDISAFLECNKNELTTGIYRFFIDEFVEEFKNLYNTYSKRYLDATGCDAANLLYYVRTTRSYERRMSNAD